METPQYIAYLWNPISLDRHAMKSRDNETFKSFKERVAKCYPDWTSEISEFRPIY